MHSNTEETTPDSPEEPISEQVNGRDTASSRSRKFRLLRTLLITLVVLAGMGGVLVFSVLISRSVWHTVLNDGTPGSMAIAIDCPDNWKRMKLPNANAQPAVIQLKRQVPTGLLGWWTRIVLHQDDNAADAAQITATGFDSSFVSFPEVPTPDKNAARTKRGIETLDHIEKGMMDAMKSRPGYQITMQRIQHPLGPALHIAFIIDRTLMPIAARNKKTGKQAADVWYIIPLKAPSNAMNFIVITSSSPMAETQSLKPLYAEVIQRVHFVKKPEIKP